MREIVFRGKTIIDGAWVWVCGELVYTTTDKAPMIRVHGENCASYYTVLPETVGQYTGMTDKNGRRIFEGDIIKVLPRHPDLKTVTFDRGAFCHQDCVKTWRVYPLHDYMEHQLEVIGNIHDNPELLEVQE